ncbi:lantibiotic dehydratase C-terminal domain-containing protein [Streptomyces cadmiisoli]|uniref:lantibiotic dehydratase C-terminal domain-containing protein n=1 Tax=Streptomyces cadmiisoli TaxID=2184053 RepID=UPI0036600EB5
MTERQWISLHVFRHDDLSELLLRQIGPLATALRAQGKVHGFFYLRYWEGGPHVRVRLLVEPDRTDEVRNEATRALEEQLRAQPSRLVVDPVAYGAMARQIAAFEEHHAYDPRLRPVDTVHAIPYPPEHESFGYGPSLAAVERHFGASAMVALDVLGLPAHKQRTAALAMSLAALLCADRAMTAAPGPAGLQQPLPDTEGRSHLLDRVLSPTVDRSGPGLTRFDRNEAELTYRRARSELEATALGIRKALGDGVTSPPASATPLATWLGSITELSGTLHRLHQEGRFLPRNEQRARHPVAHALLRCLHLHMNRLGVAMAEEARLRHICALTLNGIDQGVL